MSDLIPNPEWETATHEIHWQSPFIKCGCSWCKAREAQNRMTFIEDLKQRVFCRIGVSQIHGVGVFAIRDIPVGINPMQEHRKFEFEQVEASAIDFDLELPASVKKLVKDMCPEQAGLYDCPPFSLNEIGVSFYLNHSDTPNMGELDGDFITLVPIKAGEELTVNYGTYGKLNL